MLVMFAFLYRVVPVELELSRTAILIVAAQANV
jgi:hypothetical protein